MTPSTTIYDIWVSCNRFSKARRNQICFSGNAGVNQKRRSKTRILEFADISFLPFDAFWSNLMEIKRCFLELLQIYSSPMPRGYVFVMKFIKILTRFSPPYFSNVAIIHLIFSVKFWNVWIYKGCGETVSNYELEYFFTKIYFDVLREFPRFLYDFI